MKRAQEVLISDTRCVEVRTKEDSLLLLRLLLLLLLLFRGMMPSRSDVFARLRSLSLSVADKNAKHAPFSTPQADRRNHVAPATRRMSESNGHANGCGRLQPNIAKDDSSTSSANTHSLDTSSTTALDRVMHPNIGTWEPNLTEKELLRRTWSDEFDFLYELGSAIYTYIFDHNPHCMQLFPYLEKYGDNWKDSKEFRGQALKFVQTLSQTVKNLYHMDRLVPYLYGIGQRHVKFEQRGFKIEYWDAFQDAMEFSLSEHMEHLPDLDEQQIQAAVKVWRTLALYVVHHMKIGFTDGLKGVNKYPPII